MLTRAGHGGSLLRKAEHGFAAMCAANRRLSLRLSDAPMGVVALASIVSVVVIIPAGTFFGGKEIPPSGVLSMLVFVFAPAMLTAAYSLFFERSKVYGALALLVAGVVLAVQPFAWYWLKMYLPFACAFTVVCAGVRVLAHKWRR
jgi:hypothetical protein